MNSVLKNILAKSDLPAVKRCAEIQAESLARRGKFNALYELAQSAADKREAAIRLFIENPSENEFENYCDTFTKAAAAHEIGRKLSELEAVSVSQIEQDPGSVEAIEEALREVIDELNTFADRVEKQEMKLAADSGMEYSGASPSLAALRDFIANTYGNALQDVLNNGDESSRNVFQRHFPLVEA